MKQNSLAAVKGFSVFVLASVIALVLLLSGKDADIAMVFWPSLVLAGFITAYTAFSHRVVLAIALAIPCAIGFGLENMAWTAWNASSDIHVAEDFVVVFLSTLPYTVGLCTTGGVIGWAVYTMKKNRVFAEYMPSFLSN